MSTPTIVAGRGGLALGNVLQLNGAEPAIRGCPPIGEDWDQPDDLWRPDLGAGRYPKCALPRITRARSRGVDARITRALAHARGDRVLANDPSRSDRGAR